MPVLMFPFCFHIEESVDNLLLSLFEAQASEMGRVRTLIHCAVHPFIYTLLKCFPPSTSFLVMLDMSLIYQCQIL